MIHNIILNLKAAVLNGRATDVFLRWQLSPSYNNQRLRMFQSQRQVSTWITQLHSLPAISLSISLSLSLSLSHSLTFPLAFFQYLNWLCQNWRLVLWCVCCHDSQRAVCHLLYPYQREPTAPRTLVLDQDLFLAKCSMSALTEWERRA